ncbi:MAG: hypothetical protein G01um10148_744 [Parcubacteria group bacterium Gr01-1014_8]|nr:MAG: hypothetical protein G01um10148_744 [Parcubacteria group bacterium Gr01-1014_8]
MSSARIVQKAEEYATEAHAGQFLKNKSAESFIEHPRRVVKLVEISVATDDELAAAWLHDIVEDTPVTLEDIEREFGAVITEMVDGLTDPPHFAGNPNDIRKKWQAERVKDKGKSVKRIKVADQTVNSAMMGFDPPIGWSPEHRRIYVEGARWIAEECIGVSEYLDRLFAETYEKVIKAIEADEA